MEIFRLWIILVVISGLAGCSDRKEEERRLEAQRQLESQKQIVEERRLEVTKAQVEKLKFEKEIIQKKEEQKRLNEEQEFKRQQRLAQEIAEQEAEKIRQKELAEAIRLKKEQDYVESLCLMLLTNGNIQVTIAGSVVEAYKFTISHNTATGVNSINVHCNKGVKSVAYSVTLENKISEMNGKLLDRQVRKSTYVIQNKSTPDETYSDKDDPAKRWEESKQKQKKQIQAEQNEAMRRKGYHQHNDGSWHPPHDVYRPTSTVRGGWSY